MGVSSQLYAKLADMPEVNQRDRDMYLWIWYWLLSDNQFDVLEESLHEIANAVKSDNLSGQTLAEMAWKAHAIELLMTR